MAVKIRLTRLGKIRSPQYRIVVADSRTKRDGKVIENLGIYHPKESPSRINIDSERVQYWLGVGAQPSEPVKKLLCKTGDWQHFKGLPAPAPLEEAEPKPDKDALYAAALKEVGIDPAKAAEAAEAEKAKKSAKKSTSKSKKSAEKQDESAKSEPKAKTDEKSETKSEPKAKAEAESEGEAETEANAESKSAAPAEDKGE
ncbi:30S ribosomal protein S16 [Glycomyces xiaoerkulensis]|uniref:30S ribosomal protein S16 n=1 Tax=Glycomyces xiaoerkulensis TaxID=2038139 RepID=UPI000C257766|nr:30S ribosomal protein S16 [Glycomyces xiaoerkulensis]